MPLALCFMEAPFARAAAARRSRDQREPAESGGAVHLEVSPVEREDPADALAFGDPHERSVGQVHGKVAILLHELPHARNVLRAKWQHLQTPVLNRIP